MPARWKSWPFWPLAQQLSLMHTSRSICLFVCLFVKYIYMEWKSARPKVIYHNCMPQQWNTIVAWHSFASVYLSNSRVLSMIGVGPLIFYWLIVDDSIFFYCFSSSFSPFHVHCSPFNQFYSRTMWWLIWSRGFLIPSLWYSMRLNRIWYRLFEYNWSEWLIQYSPE